MSFPWPLCAALVLLGGCYPRIHNHLPPWASGEVPSEGFPFAAALYQTTGVRMQEGNAVQWADNGRVFDEMVDAIHRAKVSINVLSFIWRPGRASERLLSALEARRPNVACRVMVDDLGSNGFEPVVGDRLRAMGCEALLFRQVEHSSVRKALARTHRKVLVVDGKEAITGGFGIQDQWLGNGLRKDQWRDANVRVRGPVVTQLQHAFAESWIESGGTLLPPEEFPVLPREGNSRAAFVTSMDTVGMSDAERMTLLLIGAARTRLWLANSYFVPSDAVLEALHAKRKEGVDVRVLCSGDTGHDQPLVLTAQRRIYEGLVQSGIRLFEYQPAMMHSKTMLVNDSLVVVGSINLDTLSLNKMDEGALVVEDSAVATTLAAAWEEDLKLSAEVSPGAKRLGEDVAGNSPFESGPAPEFETAAGRERRRPAHLQSTTRPSSSASDAVLR